jgi:hypothetical protein
VTCSLRAGTNCPREGRVAGAKRLSLRPTQHRLEFDEVRYEEISPAAYGRAVSATINSSWTVIILEDVGIFSDPPGDLL